MNGYRSNIQLAQDADRIARSLDEHSTLHMMDELTAFTNLAVKSRWKRQWDYLVADLLSFVMIPWTAVQVIGYGLADFLIWLQNKFWEWQYRKWRN